MTISNTKTSIQSNEEELSLVYGHGITDISTKDDEGNTLKAYSQWKQMLARCYSDYVHNLRPNYKGCSVVAEWCTFSVFKEWFDANYVEGGCIDKDLALPGNKIYGPQTCVVIPNCINTLIGIKRSNSTGFPGVSYNKSTGKYRTKITTKSGTKSLGSFSKASDAFKVYKQAKEIQVKKVALMAYEMGQIDERVLQNLLEYKVEV